MHWSIIALWVFVLLQFIVIFMLTKLIARFLNKLQIKEAHEKNRGFQVGDKAPPIHYNSLNGEPEEFPGGVGLPVLALFIANGCPFCESVLANLSKMTARYPFMRVIVFTAVEEKMQEKQNGGTLEFIHSIEAFTIYNIKGIPAAMLIDNQGIIAIKAEIANYKHLQKLVDEYFTGEKDRYSGSTQEVLLDLGNM